METITTTSFEETQKVGFNFANQVKNGGIVALYGDLGAGKTTFVQGIAKGLGIQRRIISPTFVIVRTYQIKDQRSKIKTTTQNSKLYHIDLYRTETLDDIKGLGIEEILNDPQNIVVIEWAEKMKDILPKKRIDIHFEYIDEVKRKIVIGLAP